MPEQLTDRARTLIEEFSKGEDVHQGIANVLTHLADQWYVYTDVNNIDGKYESLYAVPTSTIEALTAELTGGDNT